MAGEESVEYFGNWESVDAPAPLPSDSNDQRCAVCGDEVVHWLHPLAKGLVEFSVHGEGYTLPAFWTLCAECESLHLAGDEGVMRSRLARFHDHPTVSDLDAASLVAFRRADLGGRAFSKNPPTS